MNRTAVVVAAGLAVGVLLAAVLPSSWVFVAPPSAPATAEGGATKYACPMFCVVLDEPTPDNRCPVCGMELGAISGEASLDAAEQHMAGLTATTAARVPLVRTVRALGEVDYDETRLSRVTTRVQGWLGDVAAETTWAHVEEGDALASIFSPELYSAARELLAAERLEGGAADPALVAAATTRLRLLGLGAEEIDAIRASGTAPEELVLRAPRDGVIVERNAVAGASVMRGATLYTVADLSRVWVQTEVFEDDLPLIRPGQPARLRVEATGAESEGRVAFVDPVIDRTSRTARVRIEVDNPLDEPEGARRLRVGQRVEVVIEARLDARGDVVPSGTEPAEDPVAVPRSAVLRTGRRAVVYVLFTEKSPGGPRDHRLDPDRLPKRVLYEMIEVIPGPEARAPGASTDDRVVILGVRRGRDAGPHGLTELAPGTTVVTDGNLLLDSQAQLSGRPSLLFPEGNRGASAGGHSGH